MSVTALSGTQECFRVLWVLLLSLTSGEVCANVLSASQVHGLSPKCALGLTAMQKALMCLSLPTLFSKTLCPVQLIHWRCFRGAGKEDEFNEYFKKNQFCSLRVFFLTFQSTEEGIAALSNGY